MYSSESFSKERLLSYSMFFLVLFIPLFILGFSIDSNIKKYTVGAKCFVIETHQLGKIDSIIQSNSTPLSFVKGKWYQYNEIEVIK